jgi:hypothetical protein
MSEGAGKVLLRAALATVCLASSSACDIVQGFENAGDALFPPQKTYLETPGFRLAAGGFHRLNVGIGDELYLLARDPDPMAEPALYSMRYLDPKPCKIEGVVRYWSSGLPSDYPAQIVYLKGDGRRGPLYFADAQCNVHDLVLPDADLPLQETEVGLLISSGSDLVLVDAPKGTYRTVASGIQAMFLNGPGAHYLVIEGRLHAYAQGSWDFIGSVGEGVRALRGVGGWFVYEDVNGVHGVAATSATALPQLAKLEIDPQGCRIGWVSGSVLAYYSPCPGPEVPVSEQTISLYDASKDETTHLDYAADPYLFAIELDPKTESREPRLDRDYWYYSNREPTGDGGGTLVVRSPEGEEFVLGTGARLDRTNLDEEGEWGLALLDVAGDNGRLVRWERDGSVETLATGVLYGSSDTIVNWNGSVGDRARISDDGELEILLERVPRRDYEYQDESRRWRAIFDDSDGITGTLSIDASESKTFANKRAIARRVRHGRHKFLDVLLPGIAYVADYDVETDTGRLEYNNLELGFRGIISEGVADFIPAGNGILYTVPFGSARGVWIARAQ